jgi:hypothetical protein
MKSVRSRAALSLLLAAAAQHSVHGIALGHTSGSGATPEHVLLEVAEWGLAVAAALGLIVLVFWVRAKRRKE